MAAAHNRGARCAFLGGGAARRGLDGSVQQLWPATLSAPTDVSALSLTTAALARNVRPRTNLVFHRPASAASACVQSKAPYNVIVVAIEEDPSIRLVGNLVNDESGSIDEVDPAAIQVGDAVRAVFARMTKDVTLIRWIRRS